MEDILVFFSDLFKGMRDRAHWRRFLCNPLWLGLPVAGGIAFGGVFYLMRATPDAARSEAWLATLLTALAWLGGMWSATRTEAEKPFWEREDRPRPQHRPPLRQMLIYYGFLAFGAALVLGSLFFEGREAARESGRMSDGVAFVVYWLLVVSAAALPGWITRKLK